LSARLSLRGAGFVWRGAALAWGVVARSGAVLAWRGTGPACPGIRLAWRGAPRARSGTGLVPGGATTRLRRASTGLLGAGILRHDATLSCPAERGCEHAPSRLRGEPASCETSQPVARRASQPVTRRARRAGCETSQSARTEPIRTPAAQDPRQSRAALLLVLPAHALFLRHHLTVDLAFFLQPLRRVGPQLVDLLGGQRLLDSPAGQAGDRDTEPSGDHGAR